MTPGSKAHFHVAETSMTYGAKMMIMHPYKHMSTFAFSSFFFKKKKGSGKQPHTVSTCLNTQETLIKASVNNAALDSRCSKV